MNTERRYELLRAAADALEAGREVPVWSLPDGVPAAEVFDHADDIARAIRVYLALDPDERSALSVRVAAETAIPGPQGQFIGDYVARGMRMNAALRKLGVNKPR